MAPVFTPFDEQANFLTKDVKDPHKNWDPGPTMFKSDPEFDLNINCVEIPDYAKKLTDVGIKAVLVNGSVGEGITMTTEERMYVLESWVDAAKKTGQQIMVHVGGTNLREVRRLARHAEVNKVSAILCLPDLFYKPRNVSDLIHYLKLVSSDAPNTPLFYYNYPEQTGVHLNMYEFLSKAGKQIPTLSGIKHTHNNLEEVSRCLTIDAGRYRVFLGCDTILLGGYSLGVDSAIATLLNVFPETLIKIRKSYEEGKLEEANELQKDIAELVFFVIDRVNFTAGFKYIISLSLGIKLGDVRPPLKPTDADFEKDARILLTKLSRKLGEKLALIH